MLRYFVNDSTRCPRSTDVLIIGGGIIGFSVAYWLRQLRKFEVTVVERDPTYCKSATVLGLGSIRQQFSEPENIQMSLFTNTFPIDIEFNPQGCLLLAGKNQVQSLRDSFQTQCDLDARVELLDKDELFCRWPWLNTTDIELGSYGYENEGWFDPLNLLKALKIKCYMLGVKYVIGEVFQFTQSPLIKYGISSLPNRKEIVGRYLETAKIETPKSVMEIAFHTVVNAAGPWAGELAKLVTVSADEQALWLPVEPRARQMYIIKPNQKLIQFEMGSTDSHQPSIPCIDTPFIIDLNSRLFIERRGLTGEFTVYLDDPNLDISSKKLISTGLSTELEVDREFYCNNINPVISKLIPYLKDADIVSSWQAVCDYNTFDQNLIVGNYSFHPNMVLCNGSSGHGTQHALAIGKAISELIFHGKYLTLDLTRFSSERLFLDEYIDEVNAF